MQATQIGSMETISAVAPQKVSVSARSSDSPEGFGQELHRDILAANAKASGPCPATAKGLVGITQPDVKVASPMTDADAAASSPAQGSVGVIQTTPNINVQSADMPTLSDGQKGSVARLPTIPVAIDAATLPAPQGLASPVPPPKVEAAAVPAAKSGAPGAKRAAKTGSVANSSAVAASFVVPSTGVPVNIAADVLQVNPKQKLAAGNSAGVPNLSAASKPDPTPAELATPTLALPLPTGTESLTSGSAKQASPTTAAQPKSQHGAISVVASVNPTAAGASATLSAASSIAGSSHANQVASLSAVTTTPAPIPPAPISPALSSARADLQPHAAAAFGPVGIGAAHILPSGPIQLDVGVLDGTHGWLRIRAELGSGGVSASLTASPLAHESLNAALPEMAKYLGSEAVSVTKLVVHSFSEVPDKMAFGSEANQQNGSAHERHPDGESTLTGGDAQKRESAAPDQHEAAAATSARSPMAPTSGDPAATAYQRNPALTQAIPQSQWSIGGLEGISGNWLNVCA